MLAVHDLDLQHGAGLALVHEVLQPAPGAFQLLERRVVQDLVQLERKQVIDLRNARIDHHLGVPGDRHGSVEELRDEFLDQILAALFRCGFFAEAAFFNDLIEKPLLEDLLTRCRRGLGGLCISH